MLLLAPVFSHGICTGKLCHHPGKQCCPSGPERSFQLGARGLVLLSLAVTPLLESAFSPPAALYRLMLEFDLIFLARPVILSSSHSTFQSILGTTAAQLGQLHPCGGPEPQGLFLVLLWFSILPVHSPNCSKCMFALFGFSLPFFPNPALVIASKGGRYNMSERGSDCYFLGNFLFMFLILASAFIYALVAQVLWGSAELLAFKCLWKRPDTR